MDHTLDRFLQAQEHVYSRALQEVRKGQKLSHWMWYIFPQIHGLGYSDTARYYAIRDRAEAEAYLKHPVLGSRLREITYALIFQDCRDAQRIFGYTDSMKLRSCMTLFYAVSRDFLFQKVLDLFFRGESDALTLEILQKEER